ELVSIAYKPRQEARVARKPPTRKYRKRKPGRDRALPPVGKHPLRIKQVRSAIGRAPALRRTLEALGLQHQQDVVVQPDHPDTRGMLHQVRHLVEVTPAGKG